MENETLISFDPEPTRKKLRIQDTVFSPGLGRTLFLYFLALSLIPFLILAAIAYHYVSDTTLHDQYQQLIYATQTKKNAITNYIRELSEQVHLQAETENTVALLRELSNALSARNGDLAAFVTSAQWELIVKQYQHELNRFTSGEHYVDIYLVDKRGNILYTQNDGGELGVNIYSGQYANTHLSTTARRSQETGRTKFSDIAFYKPYNEQPAAFITHPVTDNQGDKLGIIAAQISLLPIEKIMRNRVIGGATVKTYLIGEDTFLRSNLEGNDATRLTLKINNRATTHWLNSLASSHRTLALDYTFSDRYQNAANIPVLGTYQALNISGVKWAVFSEIDEHEALQQVFELRDIVIILLSLTVLFIIATALFVTQQTVNPLACIVDWARNISHGRLQMTYIISHDKEVDELNQAMIGIVKSLQQAGHTIRSMAHGELSTLRFDSDADDELSCALGELVDKHKSLTARINKIGGGDYATPVEPMSEQDILANALIDMTGNISSKLNSLEQQRWLAEGRVKLLQCALRNPHERQTNRQLAHIFIATVARYLDAKVGLLYLADKQRLTLAGSYSYTPAFSAAHEFNIGEGLVGQAARQPQAIVLQSVPDGHIDIHSGIGKVKAHTVLVSSFSHNGQLGGVIELAFMEPPQHDAAAFLDATAEQTATLFLLGKTGDTAGPQAARQIEVLQRQKERLVTENNDLLHKLNAQQQEILAQRKALEQGLVDRGDAILHEITHNLGEKAIDLAHARNSATNFISNIAHGLRAPLKRMRILSKALSKNPHTNLSTDQQESAQVINRSCDDLLDTVKDLFVLARLETGEIPPQHDAIRLDAICRKLKTQFDDALLNKALSMDVHIDDALPEVIHCDMDILEKILSNLLSSAIKFTNAGSITLRARITNHGVISDDGGQGGSGDSIIISVIDSGVGISAENRATVFDVGAASHKSTYRDNRAGNLSLAIAKRLSKVLHGDLVLRDNPSEGCHFDVILPVNAAGTNTRDNEVAPSSEAGHEPEPRVQITTQPLPDGAKTQTGVKRPGLILLIDDDGIRAKQLREILDRANYACFVSNSGDNVETLIKLHNPLAMILNPDMTDMNGTSVTDILKKSPQAAGIPLYLSGADGTITRARATGENPAGEVTMTLDQVFNGTSVHSSGNIKHILLVVADLKSQLDITTLLEDTFVQISAVDNAADAYNQLVKRHYDCVVMDIALPDISGEQLLEQLSRAKDLVLPPVIVYTGKDLSERAHRSASRYSDVIIMHGEHALQRLRHEVDAHLHGSDTNLPPGMRQRVEMLHSEQQCLRGKSILLLDNDFLSSYPLSTALKRCGMSVVVADDGEAGMKMLTNNGPFDIILMDIPAPLSKGLDTIRAIRALPAQQSIPIVALTDKANNNDGAACLSAGASDYITKPIDIDKLLPVMQIWLSSSEQDKLLHFA